MRNEFGFLINPLRMEFLGVSISPLPDHAEKLTNIQKLSNKDGFYYPPQVSTYHVDIKTNSLKEKVERTERPAQLFFLPSSHQITIENPICIDGEKGTDEALIVFLLAYIYGTRLMPSKWKFDGRVPINPTKNFSISDVTTLHFLEHVYVWWNTLGRNQQTKFVNILYVFSRARSLEWEWDAFIHQYMIFDALYNLHLEFQPNKKAKNHEERFEILCCEYSVFNKPLTEKIYSTRNDLFHEAIWEKSTIGFGSSDEDYHQLPQHLSEINSQVICGITGYKNQYIHTDWWTQQMLEFDKMNDCKNQL